MSVSDLGIYRKPYESILTKTHILSGLPYVASKDDPLWDNCEAVWPALEKQLDQHREVLTAVIVEPIVQGAAGMQIYSQDFLKRLRTWTHTHGIHLIADEIMTGLGRTGLPLACQHAGIEPDFLCLGKALSAGALPLSAVLTSENIYQLFYDDYEKEKSFLHSHTHTGNALAISAALAMFEVMELEKIYEKLPLLEVELKRSWQALDSEGQFLKNKRGIGAIVAADLVNAKQQHRPGFEFYKKAIRNGALIRPIGPAVYWFLPLNVEKTVIVELEEITRRCFKSVE